MKKLSRNMENNIRKYISLYRRIPMLNTDWCYSWRRNNFSRNKNTCEKAKCPKLQECLAFVLFCDIETGGY